MNNDNTKWEPVDPLALETGDKVRLTCDGECFRGEITGPNKIKLFQTVHAFVSDLVGSGYSFERAVPERTLPTEPDIYWSPSERRYFELASEGDWWTPSWTRVDRSLVPTDLVRLVPVTEADELRERIEKARGVIEKSPSLIAFGARVTLLAMLDGEG